MRRLRRSEATMTRMRKLRTLSRATKRPGDSDSRRPAAGGDDACTGDVCAVTPHRWVYARPPLASSRNRLEEIFLSARARVANEVRTDDARLATHGFCSFVS